MRKRELIAQLKFDWLELRRTQCQWFGNATTIQANEIRRATLFHSFEKLLPEIIEKLEAKS